MSFFGKYFFLVFLFTQINANSIKHTESLPCPKCKELIEVCHPILQEWFAQEQNNDPQLHIMTSYRNEKEQNRARRSGASGVGWGGSAHNYIPCFAVDLFFLVDGKSKQLVARYQAMIKRMPPTIENGKTFARLVDWSHFYVKDWKQLAKNYPFGNALNATQHSHP